MQNAWEIKEDRTHDLGKAYFQSNIGPSVSVWDTIPLDITSSHMRLGTETGKRRSECKATVGHQRSLNSHSVSKLGD